MAGDRSTPLDSAHWNARNVVGETQRILNLLRRGDLANDDDALRSTPSFDARDRLELMQRVRDCLTGVDRLVGAGRWKFGAMNEREKKCRDLELLTVRGCFPPRPPEQREQRHHPRCPGRHLTGSSRPLEGGPGEVEENGKPESSTLGLLPG